MRILRKVCPTLVAALALAVMMPATKAAPLPKGGNSPLAQIPVSAPLVVHLHGLDRTIDRLITMVNNVDPRSAKKLKDFSQMIHNLPDGRKIQGLDPSGPIFVVFLTFPSGLESLQKMAIVLKTKNYKDFRDGILKADERKSLTPKKGYEIAAMENGEGICFVNKQDYTAITPSEKVAQQLAGKFRGLDTRLSQVQAKKLLEGDFGVYLAMDVFGKQYAEQIKESKKGIEEALDQAEQVIGKAQAANLRITKELIGTAFQAVEDSQGMLFTVEFRPTALALHFQSELRSGTKTSKSLADFSSNEFSKLGQLPKNQLAYAGWEANPNLLKLLGSLVTGVSGENEAIKKGLEALAKAGPGEQIYSMNLPMSSAQSWTMKKPTDAKEAMLKMFQAMSKDATFGQMPLKGKPVIAKDTEKYKGITFNSVKVAWDFKKMLDQSLADLPVPEEQKDQMVKGYQNMMGENLNIWFGTDGKQLITVTGKNWTAAKAMLDQFLANKGVGKVESFAAARKHMPAKSTFLAMIDVERYAEVVLKAMKDFAGAFIPFQIPNGKESETPGYAGFALTFNNTRGAMDLVITTQAAKNIGRRWLFPLFWAD